MACSNMRQNARILPYMGIIWRQKHLSKVGVSDNIPLFCGMWLLAHALDTWFSYQSHYMVTENDVWIILQFCHNTHVQELLQIG